MIVWTVRAASLLAETALLQVARTLPDTIVTKQVASSASIFTTFTGILSALATLAILVLAVALVPAVISFRKSYRKIDALVDRLHSDVAPIVRHAEAIADNVDYLTTTVRSDVQRVHRTVGLANDRLLAAIDAAERRVRDFEALLDVAQREAEGVFVATAATVRGVRYGTATLREELESDGITGLGGASARRRARHLDEEPIDDEFDATEDERGADEPGRGPRIRPRSAYDDELA